MGTAQKSTSITHKRESPKQRVVYNIHPPLVALSLKRSFDVKKMEGNGFLLGNLTKIVSTSLLISNSLNLPTTDYFKNCP